MSKTSHFSVHIKLYLQNTHFICTESTLNANKVFTLMLLSKYELNKVPLSFSVTDLYKK